MHNINNYSYRRTISLLNSIKNGLIIIFFKYKAEFYKSDIKSAYKEDHSMTLCTLVSKAFDRVHYG